MDRQLDRGVAGSRHALKNPFGGSEWARLVEEWGFTGQQARIVELVLCGLGDKQIAMKMELRLPTVRSHLQEISGRVELILRVMAMRDMWVGMSSNKMENHQK